MVEQFNSARGKQEWGADDLNLFARAIGTLFDGEGVANYYFDIFESDPPTTKAEAVVALPHFWPMRKRSQVL